MISEYDSGVLDQIEADLPALRRLEAMARDQYERAERYYGELDDAQRSKWRLMVVVLVQFFVIVVLVACLFARSC